MVKEQLIRLCDEDRDLIKKLVKWIRFFPLMYLILWIFMCLMLFIIMWTLFSGR